MSASDLTQGATVVATKGSKEGQKGQLMRWDELQSKWRVTWTNGTSSNYKPANLRLAEHDDDEDDRMTLGNAFKRRPSNSSVRRGSNSSTRRGSFGNKKKVTALAELQALLNDKGFGPGQPAFSQLPRVLQEQVRKICEGSEYRPGASLVKAGFVR